jgi:hypothetical protein
VLRRQDQHPACLFQRRIGWIRDRQFWPCLRTEGPTSLEVGSSRASWEKENSLRLVEVRSNREPKGVVACVGVCSMLAGASRDAPRRFGLPLTKGD